MIGEIISSIPGILISGYEGLIGNFGSPAVLLALSATLIVAAAIELCIRNCKKRAKEAV
ncbi:MAG: hypothetical protein WBZ29_06430 [Methanocella sp.]